MSYTEAFDAMVDMFRTSTRSPSYKDIDWDAIAAEFRPALRGGRGEPTTPTPTPSRCATSCGRSPTSTSAVRPNALDDDVRRRHRRRARARPWPRPTTASRRQLRGRRGPGRGRGHRAAAPRSSSSTGSRSTTSSTRPCRGRRRSATPQSERLQQLRYAMRFPLDTGTVDITYQNPGETQATNGDARRGRRDARASAPRRSTPASPPTCCPSSSPSSPSGYGYIRISSFFDNELLTIQLWERMIQYAQRQRGARA